MGNQRLRTRWSNRATAGACLAAVVLALSVFCGLPASAHADEIPIQWDGPTLNLAWDAGSYATSSGSIVGNVVAVPGDRAERTAVIQNGGPSPARVTVQISNVTTTNAPDTANGDLESLIHLFWNINGNRQDVTWRDAREAADPNGVSYWVSFYLGQGEKFPLTAGYYFPASATAGKNEGAPSSILSFEVHILMQGDDYVKAPTGGTAVSSSHFAAAASLVMAGIVLPIAARLCRRRASVAQR